MDTGNETVLLNPVVKYTRLSWYRVGVYDAEGKKKIQLAWYVPLFRGVHLPGNKQWNFITPKWPPTICRQVSTIKT